MTSSVEHETQTMLFGVNVSTSAADRANPVADAMRAEALGFDFISANDHPCGSTPSYELWTMLTWIAAKTTRIKVASRVLGVPYRPAAMVAKMAESLDRFSRGRLILGVGGGYSDEEFRAFGLNVPTPKDKIDGLEEAVRIMRGLWSSPRFTFEGRHHRTEEAELEPKPGRHIPIWLGTFGRRSLAVTGRVADGWIPTFSMAGPHDVPAMRERIFEAARSAGAQHRRDHARIQPRLPHPRDGIFRAWRRVGIGVACRRAARELHRAGFHRHELQPCRRPARAAGRASGTRGAPIVRSARGGRIESHSTG